MRREWKPGDVAIATVKGVGEVTVFRVRGAWAYTDPRERLHPSTYVAIYDKANEVEDARPLLVIDPEDRAQVERLRDLWDAAHEDQQGHRPSLSARAARGNCLQAALRSLLAPPKPDEPQGLGAVVEDGRKVVWIRTDQHPDVPWQRRDIDCGQGDWSDVAAPVRVLSEGVTR